MISKRTAMRLWFGGFAACWKIEHPDEEITLDDWLKAGETFEKRWKRMKEDGRQGVKSAMNARRN